MMGAMPLCARPTHDLSAALCRSISDAMEYVMRAVIRDVRARSLEESKPSGIRQPRSVHEYLARRRLGS